MPLTREDSSGAMELDGERPWERILREADQLVDNDLFIQALAKFQEALELVGSIAREFRVRRQILTGIGDMLFLLARWDEARQSFEALRSMPGAPPSPFVNLRLGQCYFELGDRQAAAREFRRARALAGNSIFVCEDPRYLTTP